MITTARGYKAPEPEDMLAQSADHIRETLEIIDGEQTDQDETLAGHGQRLDGLDSSVSQLSADVTQVSTDVGQLTTGLSQVSGDLGQLGSEVSQISDDLDGLSTQVSQISGNVGQLSTDLTQVTGSVNQLTTDLSQVSSDVDQVADDVDQVASDLTRASNDLNQALSTHSTDAAAHAAAFNHQRPWATAAEAIAGTASNRVMSPARVAEAIQTLTPEPDVIGQINARLGEVLLVVHAANAGGSFSSGGWRTRTLDTVWYNGIAGASLANNLVRLPAGLYEIEWWGAAYGVNRNMTRLYNSTSGQAYVGMPCHALLSSNVSFTVIAIGRAVVPVSSTSQFSVQHICETTSSYGFGYTDTFNVQKPFAGLFARKIG